LNAVSAAVHCVSTMSAKSSAPDVRLNVPFAGLLFGAAVTDPRLAITTGNDPTGHSYYNQRPNVVPGVNPIVHNWSPATGYLNPAAFSVPADGTFGNLCRNCIYGPGYKNLDFSVTKNTQLVEKLNLQLRAEFFNILNHPNFAQPAHTVPGNGAITQTPDVAQTNPGLGGGGPRVVQLALKVVF